MHSRKNRRPSRGVVEVSGEVRVSKFGSESAENGKSGISWVRGILIMRVYAQCNIHSSRIKSRILLITIIRTKYDALGFVG